MNKIQFRYQCQLTGAVKAYKKMTLQDAEAINCVLEGGDAHGRWVSQSVSPEPERDVIYGPVSGSADERYDAAG